VRQVLGMKSRDCAEWTDASRKIRPGLKREEGPPKCSQCNKLPPIQKCLLLSQVSVFPVTSRRDLLA